MTTSQNRLGNAARLWTAALVVVGVVACPAPTSTTSTGPTIIPTGTTPNAVAPVRCGDSERALVAASGEATVDRVPLPALTTGDGDAVFLGTGTAPWDVVGVGKGLAVVSLSGARRLALIDACDGGLVQLLQAPTTLVDVAPPITLQSPRDVDGDGTAETTVTQMLPTMPQGLAAVGDEVFVVWANVLQFAVGDQPMRTGPGLLMHLSLVDDQLEVRGQLPLPCENSGAVTATRDAERGVVVVSCTGRFRQSRSGHVRDGDGGIVVVDVDLSPSIDTETLTVRDHVALPLSPGPVFLDDDAVLTGDLLDGRLRRYALDGLTLVAESEGLEAGIHSTFAITEAPDGTLWSATFAGQLTAWERDSVTPIHVVDAQTLVGGDGPLRGVVDLAFTSGGEALVLMTLSAELAVLDPRASPDNEGATP